MQEIIQSSFVVADGLSSRVPFSIYQVCPLEPPSSLSGEHHICYVVVDLHLHPFASQSGILCPIRKCHAVLTFSWPLFEKT